MPEVKAQLSDDAAIVLAVALDLYIKKYQLNWFQSTEICHSKYGTST